MNRRRTFLKGCAWGVLLGVIGCASLYADLLHNGPAPRPWEKVLNR